MLNEALIITQIIQKGDRAYALLLPYGAPYAEIYDALQEFLDENKAKQAAAIEAQTKKETQDVTNASV